LDGLKQIKQYKLNPLNKGVYVFVMEGSLKGASESVGKRNGIGNRQCNFANRNRSADNALG
jgi:hypothetical protein